MWLHFVTHCMLYMGNIPKYTNLSYQPGQAARDLRTPAVVSKKGARRSETQKETSRQFSGAGRILKDVGSLW